MSDDSRISIPEPAPDIGKGFLAELWQSDQPLPRMQGGELWLYYLKRGVDTVLSLPGSNAVTIFTITASLFIFSAFLLTLQNVDKILTEVGATHAVTAYFSDDAVPSSIEAFVDELRQRPWVQSATYVSKDDAMRVFRDELGIRASFLEGLEGVNPLPASVDLQLYQDELGIGQLDKTIDRLRAHELVDDVIYGSEWVNRVQGVISIVRFFGYIALSVVLILIVFLIANTIKLVIFSRRDEIGIMQLVGATSGFVRVPFIVGGVIQGLVGAGLAMLMLRSAFWLLTYEIRYSTVFGVALPQLMFLGPFAVLMIIILGGVIGAVGSFFALGRYMNV